MISQSLGNVAPAILGIVPYASFGAFYFLVSAMSLAVVAWRKADAQACLVRCGKVKVICRRFGIRMDMRASMR